MTTRFYRKVSTLLDFISEVTVPSSGINFMEKPLQKKL